MFFLELSCFFHDPADIGNLISDSSAFSKTSLRMFLVTGKYLWNQETVRLKIIKISEFLLFLQIINSSSQFNRSIVSDCLWSHGLEHARFSFASLTPGICSNSCPLSQWCHPAISSSVAPFSSHLQSFPASGSFSMSQFFAWGGQNIGVSASAWVLPMNIQDWFPLE